MEYLQSLSSKKFWLAIAAVFLIILFFLAFAASLPPSSFQKGTLVHIAADSSMSQISTILQNDDIIRSTTFFKTAVVLMGGQKSLLAGDYLFPKPQNALIVADRLIHGEQGLTLIKVTFPEGTDAAGMSIILGKDIPGFDTASFLKLARPDEGYLFPDTYNFLPNVTPTQVVAALKANFDQKVKLLAPDVLMSKRTSSQIVIMASIIEKEAADTTDRKIISGILWKRLDKGILLQVDAPLNYITANTSGFTSLDDTQIDSPYNTYKYKGLLPGPISNPGLDAIEAALHPTASPYFYYLSDKKGVIHYAVTFDEHETNREKYLN